jgi:diguanylate cyclase (GGDEF)-like protein
MRGVCRRAIWVLAACLTFCAGMQAQQYAFRVYRQAEGLKNLSINAMAIGRSGFPWLATENGIYRFLGSGFERYGSEQGITGIDIRDVFTDPGWIVWAATDQGLFHWDGQRFEAETTQPIRILGTRRMAAEDERNLLVVDGGRLYRLEHDADGRMLSYQPVLTERILAANPQLRQISSVSVVREGAQGFQIWVGSGTKLYSWPGGVAQPYDGVVTEWGPSQGLRADQWQTVLVDREGTVWTGGEKFLAARPRGSAYFVDRSIPGAEPDNTYGHAALTEDPEGRMLAPADDRIAIWEGTAWHLIGEANGLGYDGYVVGLIFDAAGDLWIANRGDGLYHWNGYADWEGWGRAQGLPAPAVWGIQPSWGKGVLVATAKGPAQIDLSSGLVHPLLKGPSQTFSSQTALGLNRDGSLFAVTLEGSLLRIDPKTGRFERTGKLPDLVDSVIQDAAGHRFLPTHEGVYLLNAGDSRGVPKRIGAVDKLLGGSRRIETGCAAPGGEDWLLTANRLLRFKDGTWTEPQIDGMPKLNGSLLAITCPSAGTLWVTGEQAGVWKLTERGGRLAASQLQLPHSLQSLSYLAILVDHRGWVWLGSDAGLAVWNGQSWRHLTQESGLIWNDIDENVLREGPEGSLWIGTSGGLAHLIHPEHVFAPVPLGVLVTGIQRGSHAYPLGGSLTLPWAATPLRIQISSPTMRNRSELSFSYRMNGLQPDWLESQDGLAVFAALPPGNYVFEARVRNPGLRATSQPVQIAVHVLAPWWRRNWFYGFCLLALLLLLLFADVLRERHTKRRRLQLEALVRERTAELEASREQLRIQATHDGLTGMLNRTSVLRALGAEMDRCRRKGRTLVVALADLDHFKQINDRYGHLAGDEALRWFAGAVGSVIRVYDHVGRYGGEEFLLVLPQIPQEAAERRLAGLHAAISNLAIRVGESVVTLTCSIGATIFDPLNGAGSAESLLSIADHALYAAKAAGRNRVMFRQPEEAHAHEVNGDSRTPESE